MSPRVTTDVRRAAHPDLALLVIVTGVLITSVDGTIVVLALPEIQRSLRIGLSSSIWVVIGYLLVITLLATQVGRLGDMFGRVRMYQAGFAIFIASSLACALAWNELSLVLFRVVQGLGGALITANSGAVIADTFPPEKRGRAYGFNAVGYNTGAVLGIVLGGVIVTYTSWRWIFWINLPIGLAAMTAAHFVLADRGERTRRKIDGPGMVTLGAGLFGLLWGMVTLTSEPFDATVAVSLAGGLVLLFVFVVIERGSAEPMLELSIFRLPTMSASLLAAFFQTLSTFAVVLLLLMYLQGVRDLTPLHASLLLVPGYALSAIVGPLSGRLADRRGPVLPATIGLAVQIPVLLGLAQLGTHTPLWSISVLYIGAAAGVGTFFPANNAAVMKAAPGASFGIASGLLRTFVNVGMVFSFALAIVIASASVTRSEALAIFAGTSRLSPVTGPAFTHGLHGAFYASAALLVVAAVLSGARGNAIRT